MGYSLKTVLLFFVLTVNAAAQSGWSTPINISANPDTALYGYDIQAGSDGTIYIVYDDCWGPECSITELVLKKSTDGGLTWSGREVISDGLGTYWYPQMAIDSRGGIHVVYYKRGERRLYYITSDNNWTTPVPYTEYGTQNARIYVDRNDVIHFFWTIFASNRLVAHRSLDHGIWSEPEIISDIALNCTGSSVCFDEENNMHVIFEGTQMFEDFHIFYRKRSSEGWGNIEIAATDTLDYPRSYSLSIIYNKLYVIWSKWVSWELLNQIYWTKKNGNLWTVPEPIVSHSLAFDPSVGIDHEKNIHLVWIKKSAGGKDSLFYCFYRNSIWSEIQKITFQLLNPPSLPEIISADKQIYLLFLVPSEYVYSNSDLYFSRRSILSDVDTQINISKVEIYVRAYPNPFNSQTNIIFNINSPSRVTIKLFDILGRELEMLFDEEVSIGNKQFSCNFINYSSGIYFCRITTDTDIGEIKLSLVK